MIAQLESVFSADEALVPAQRKKRNAGIIIIKK